MEATNTSGGVRWVDMTQAPGALAGDGLALDDVRRHIYARDETGRLHRGTEAFALMWSNTPGRRWLARVITLPVLRWLARLVYDWFADRLYAWNTRKGRW